MKRALDNYQPGKLIEVVAWKGESIPASCNRFFCPECFESVTLDIRGRFRHQNRTAETDECSRRVDNPSISAYEKMALPVYLEETDHGIFGLSIGFSGQPIEAYNQAEKDKSFLVISNGEKEWKYQISQERFSVDRCTKIPVYAIPCKNQAYQVKYSAGTPSIFKERWTEKTDIWGKYQFFNCTSGSYRKIRQLGTILTDRDYFFIGVDWIFYNYKYFVNVSSYGILQLQNQTLNIKKIHIDSGRAKGTDLSKLSTFFMKVLKINLSTEDSSLAPLWPPCNIDDNYFIYDQRVSRAALLIKSPNDNPKVFRYKKNSYEELKTVTKPYKLCNIPMESEPVPVSVDRAFNGNLQYLTKVIMHSTQPRPHADIIDEQGQSLLKSKPTSLCGKQFIVVSPCFCNIVLRRNDGSEIFFKLDGKDGVTIGDVHWNDEILVYTRDWKFLLSYLFSQETSDGNISPATLMKHIQNAEHTPLIDLDSVTLAIVRGLKCDSNLKKRLLRYINIGKIPKGVADILRVQYRRN